jgi:hypothetical protein
MSIRRKLWGLLLLAWLPVGCGDNGESDSADSGGSAGTQEDSGGTPSGNAGTEPHSGGTANSGGTPNGGAGPSEHSGGTANSGGTPNGGAESGGAPSGGSGGQTGGAAGSAGTAGEECTYQGMGAADPRPVELDCDEATDGPPGWDPPQFCAGTTHAALLIGACGSSAFCTDSGDWTGEIAASVGREFGEVVSTLVIGNDESGLEVIIELADGASTSTLTLAGTYEGIELCYGNPVSCPISTSFPLDMSESDCTNLGKWYGGWEVGSQLDLVTGTN